MGGATGGNEGEPRIIRTAKVKECADGKKEIEGLTDPGTFIDFLAWRLAISLGVIDPQEFEAEPKEPGSLLYKVTKKA